MRTLLPVVPLLLTGCLVGTDHLKGIPNTPTLDGEVVLLAPEPGPDGAFAREGDTVEIAFSTLAAIDPEASIVTLDGFPMDFAGSDGFTYRYQRTLDGSEGSSPKTVTGTLRNAAERQGALGSPVLLETDFIPPTGSCVLNPRAANANDAITFVVTPSEPLREPPAITPSASELSVTFREQVEGQFFYDVVGETGVNLDGYVLTVEAFDRAGNPQRGDSLCEVEDRTGALLGRGPALDGEPSLTAAPSVEVGGVPWVREGAVLTVSIPTAEPIDADASSVALSGLDLAPVADTPNTWTLTLDGTEGDGFKNLDAVLFDAAGNTLRVQRPAITRFDFTPPTADCVLSPREANGEQAVTFDVFASEPLDGGAPTVTPSDPRITVGAPESTGNQHRYAVSGPPGEDVVYTLDVQGTDLAGNPADGPLCPEADTSGAIRGRGPEVVGDIVVSLEPSIDIDGVPSARAGAELRVTIPTAQAVDPGRSIISLSGVPLVHDDTQPGTWARTLDGTEGDGLKRLDARLFDAAGNTRQEIRDDVVRFDFTAPSGACSIAPNPANRAQKPVFSFTPNEPLLHRPAVMSLQVSVDWPELEGGRWNAELTGPPVGNVDYTLQITATDRVGNVASDDDVCPEADRQGQIFNRPPSASAVALSVSGLNTHTPAIGPPRVGLGAVVEVTLTSDSELDPAATTVQVGEIRLTHAEGLTWRHTVAEGDLDGLKTLAVSLVDVAGNTAPADGAGQGVVIDLTPPEASCVLSPALANANDTITLDVFVSETLPEAPTLDVGGAPLTASSPTLTGNRYRYTLTQTASENVSYQLSLSATDLVGNAQDGDSLCEPDSRSGTIQGVGPALQGAEVALTVAPSTYTDGDGRPWAKTGDVVTVTFDLVNPSALDLDASSVALSGLELTPDSTGTTWTVTLDGTEGDGAKNLNARLVDTAGNALVVTRTAITRFDFTPPSASCSIAPNPANGTQTVVFTLAPTETLGEPPSVTSGEVMVEDLAFDGTRWTARIVAPPNVDTPYTLDVSATDRVGNTATGEGLCPMTDRQGRVNAVAPVASAVTLTVSGANTFEPDSGLPRVGLGAVVEVVLTTSSDLDLAATVVQVGDIRLAHQEGLTWRHTIIASDLDGPKNLAVSLVDTAGNTAAADAAGQGVVVDLTPPSAACSIAPNPANGTQTVVFTLAPTETLVEPPSVSSEQVSIEDLAFDGTRWTARIVAPADADTPYTLDVSATDRVGNTAVGEALCPLTDRQGRVNAVAPVASAVTLTVSGANTFQPDSGLPRVGLGAVVEVVLTTSSDLDLAATVVQVGDIRLAHQEGLTWRHTVAASDLDGPKNLAVNLVDTAGNTAAADAAGQGVVVDLTPPSANCVLFPPVANGEDEVTLQVFASEELLTPPTAAVDHPDVAVALNPASTGNPHLFNVSLIAPIDAPTYTVTLTATDLVGNAQTGDSLCSESSRTGAFFGVPPVLSGDITLTATPCIDQDGTPRAKAGALVTVTIPTEQPISPSRSFVSLSGFTLSSTDGITWTGTLDPILGDGPKTLTATLVDGAGNTLAVQDPTVAVIADFTPPQVTSAILTRTPFFATADDGSGTVLFTTTDPLSGQAVSASLRVTTTEDLGEPALLEVHGPAPLTLMPAGSSARLATWSLPGIPEGQDGAYTFEVTLEDAVGNRSEPLPLDVTLEIDTEAPSVGPDVDAPDLITYIRQPWGPSSVSGSPTFRVVGGIGSVPEGVLVTVENVSGGILGSSQSAMDGGLEISFGADLPEVLLRHHDAAGNPSPRSRVRDFTWTASMAGKVLGSARENPHQFHGQTVAPVSRRTSAGIPSTEHASWPVKTTASSHWFPEDDGGFFGSEPYARYDHALTYDSARGVVVLFGGETDLAGSREGCGLLDISACPGTWERDGTIWRQVMSALNEPAMRGGHAMAYDASRGVTVLFGGLAYRPDDCDGLLGCNDTWEWNGTTWTAISSVDAPTRRWGHALGYDARRRVTVMFGGRVFDGGSWGSIVSSDTWEWDGSNWEQAQPESAPEARVGHSLAYDARRGTMVLFGGCSSTDHVNCHQYLADLWEWDGERWTEILSESTPPPRANHTMVYDVVRGKMVLFGGDQGGVVLSDLWEWDGERWTERVVQGSPPERTRHAMTFDRSRNVMVLFGGKHGGGGLTSTQCHLDQDVQCDDVSTSQNLLPIWDCCRETWEWDGESWQHSSRDQRPHFREGRAISYDTSRDVMTLFGGTRIVDFSGFEDTTWEREGRSWKRRNPENVPPARTDGALVYDESRGLTILFGGYGELGSCGTPNEHHCSDTWEWDGVDWTERSPETFPPARRGHAMAYDSDRGLVTLFGGQGSPSGSCGVPSDQRCTDTWEWDGVSWSQRNPDVSPPGIEFAEMVYDPGRQVTVLSVSPVDTWPREDFLIWEWDGETWSGFSEFGQSPRLVGYPSSLGAPLFIDGVELLSTPPPGPSPPIAMTWDGNMLEGLFHQSRPPPRQNAYASVDPSKQHLLVFGGSVVPGTSGAACGAYGWLAEECSDSWSLPLDAAHTPGQTFTPSFAPALAPDATLRTVTARWTAGGSGTPGGDLTEGAELLVWNGLGWTVLDTHAAGPDAPAPLCARLVADPTAPADPGCNDLLDPALVNSLFRFGPDLTSTFAVRPTAPIGTDEGELRSEDVAVTVRYRLPPE